jgi:hypothetical protein
MKGNKKTLWARVLTQANYFHKNKLNLSRKRLHKAVGAELESGSTVDRYAQFLKSEGYFEDVKDGFFKVIKEVPKELTCK